MRKWKVKFEISKSFQQFEIESKIAEFVCYVNERQPTRSVTGDQSIELFLFGSRKRNDNLTNAPDL